MINCNYDNKKNIWVSFYILYLIGMREEKAMAPLSSTLAWKIPWTEESGGLQSMGSWRVRHYWATSLSLFTFMHWRRKWQPTPVFLPGKSQGLGSLVGCRLRVAPSQTGLKWLSRRHERGDFNMFLLYTEWLCCSACAMNYSIFMKFISSSNISRKIKNMTKCLLC